MRALLLIILLTLFGCGCGSVQAQAVAADQLAGAVNVAVGELATAYGAEGDRLIAAAESRPEAEALLEAHRKRWDPVWLALQGFAELHDGAATELEAGRPLGPGLLARLHAAFCRFASVAAERAVRMPQLVPCGVTP